MKVHIEDHLITVYKAEDRQLALIRELCVRKDIACRIDDEYGHMFIAGSKKQLYNILLEICIYYNIEGINSRPTPTNYDWIDENEVVL